MVENKVQMPGVFGGLMNYDSEFESKFMFSPTSVMGFIVALILFVIAIKIFFPL
jgi:preprotein translocase subunit Sec61beta